MKTDTDACAAFRSRTIRAQFRPLRSLCLIFEHITGIPSTTFSLLQPPSQIPVYRSESGGVISLKLTATIIFQMFVMIWPRACIRIGGYIDRLLPPYEPLNPFQHRTSFYQSRLLPLLASSEFFGASFAFDCLTVSDFKSMANGLTSSLTISGYAVILRISRQESYYVQDDGQQSFGPQEASKGAFGHWVGKPRRKDKTPRALMPFRRQSGQSQYLQ